MADRHRHQLALAGAQIESRNRWTKEGPGHLVMHPNRPGEPPVRILFPGLDARGKTAFRATVRSRNRRCPPTVLRLGIADRPDDEISVLDEITVSGAVDQEWRISFPSLSATAKLALTCQLAPNAENYHFAAVLVQDPVLTDNAEPGRTGPPAVRLMLDGEFDAYFDPADRDRDTTWVFHHIPKTAGSSLFTELGRALRPSLGVTRAPLSEFPSVGAALEHHLPEIGAGKYRFVTGHFARPQIEQIRTAPHPTAVFTILRDPVARVVSDYRYMLTPAHPGHEEIRARFPTLASFVKSEGQHDKMFRALRRQPSDTVAQVIADVETAYAFVGLTESYPLSRRALFGAIGARPPGPPLRANRTQEIAENQVDWKPLAGRIRKANHKDARLYEHFERRFKTVSGPLRSYLADLGERARLS